MMREGKRDALSKYNTAANLTLFFSLMCLLAMWATFSSVGTNQKLAVCREPARLFQSCRNPSVRNLQASSTATNLNSRPNANESTARSTETSSQSQGEDTPAGVLIGVGIGVFLLIVGIVWCVSKRKANVPPQSPASNSANEDLENKVTPVASSAENNYFYGQPPVPSLALFSTNQEAIDNIHIQVMGLIKSEIGRDSPCPPIEFPESEEIGPAVKDISPQFTVMTLYRNTQKCQQSGGWATTQDTENENLPANDVLAQEMPVLTQHKPYKIPAALVEEFNPESISTESQTVPPQPSTTSVRLTSVVIIPVETDPTNT